MKLPSLSPSLTQSTYQAASSSLQGKAEQPQFSGLKVRAPLAADTVRFGATHKHKDLDTNEIIWAPDNLEVKNSRRIGGLNAGGKITAKEVSVGGDVNAQKDLEYLGSESGGILKSAEGNIKATNSAKIGGIHALKGNIDTYEVAVQGDVMADQGDVKFISSDTDGHIHAGRNAKVERSKNINGIHAVNNIATRDILAKRNVVSDQGDIFFLDSDVWGKLQTLKGKIHVDDSDLVGGIDAAKTVFVKDSKEVRNPIEAGGDVTLRGKKTVVNDIIIHSGKSEAPNKVDIGDGVTVRGNIIFDNGNGTVLLGKDSKFLGETNGEIQSAKKNQEKQGGGLFSQKTGNGSTSTLLYPLGNGSTYTVTAPPVYGHDNSSTETITGPSSGHPLLHRRHHSTTSLATIATVATLPAYGDEAKSKRINPDTGLPEDEHEPR